jgi:acyl-CoA synthetase (AMP-forming)/AMP-acid ligase II
MSQNIGQLLTRRAYRDPNVEAIYEPANGRRFTFTELNGRSNQVANALTDSGVAKGDRVGLLLMNGAEFVETFFAVGKIGAVNVPLNWRLVPDELEFILSDAGATVLLFSEEFAEAAAELRNRGDATNITTWIQVGGDPADGVIDYDDWLASGSATEPEATGSGDDLVFIMYTSGTTGLPKGVMHSHDTVLWANLTIAATSDFRHGDVFLNSLPLFHVGALSPVIGCIYGGVSLVMLRAFDPTLSWELIRDEKVTTTLMVPAMLQFMLAVRDDEKHDASSVRWCMSGAAPVPVTLIKAYEALGIEIQQVYGLTETCGPACLITSADAFARAGSTGKAFYFTDVKVVREDGSDCDPGESGEVLVKGPHIMLGYWNRPDATAETIVDGWLHTGDVATMDEDGFVTIVDRVKDMLISGGENVYPAEIENVLLSNDKIADAGVIGIPSDKWGESPLAVVVTSDESLTADEVMEFCKGKLAPFKTVKAVEFVSEIPRNASGKILKRELREQYNYSASE